MTDKPDVSKLREGGSQVTRRSYPDDLREVLRYDPDTGVFVWTARVNNKFRAGAVAGKLNPKGYRYIKYRNVAYAAHRLAIWFTTGEVPPYYVDHINGVIDDNRRDNLRLATPSENVFNFRQNHSRELPRGVYLNHKTNRFVAGICKDGKRRYLGSFPTPEKAYAAYSAVAIELFGEFADRLPAIHLESQNA